MSLCETTWIANMDGVLCMYSLRLGKNVILIFREVKSFKLWLNLYKNYYHSWYNLSTIKLVIEYIFIIEFIWRHKCYIYYKLD